MRCLLFGAAIFCGGSATAQYLTQEQVDEMISKADTVIYIYPRARYTPTVSMFANVEPPFDWRVDSLPRRELFALKTNLLYDALTVVNIEVEVPIGRRYSVAGEWIFPWWLNERRQRCLELLGGSIEGRYWFGNREAMELLTGWSAGVYLGGGYYDLEWDGTGYQGEYLLSGGFSAGYSHSIHNSLRLEYSVAVGYLETKYRKYNAEECGNQWYLVREKYGVKRWVGPTRLRVSLSWMINRIDRRGGAI